MKIKTSELTGPALDWAVAKCEGIDVFIDLELPNYPRVLDKRMEDWAVFPDDCVFDPSTNWSQGGPIIDRESIGLMPSRTAYYERDGGTYYSYGPTPLIAAMRCFCASRLGDTIEVPEELCK